MSDKILDTMSDLVCNYCCFEHEGKTYEFMYEKGESLETAMSLFLKSINLLEPVQLKIKA